MAIRRLALTSCGTLLTALLFSVSYSTAQDTSPKLTTLYTFTGSGGVAPEADVVIGKGGVLYGTAAGGGTSGFGTVFSLTPPTSSGGAWTENVLYSFTGGNDGGQPVASVVIGKGGVLYGTTEYGGTASGYSGFGTVFSLTPPTSSGGAWTENVLYSFTGGSDGSIPVAGIVIGTGRALYGSTGWGGISFGNSGYGTVFSLTPPTSPGGAWTETTLYTFTGGSDGVLPDAVVISSGGALSGTTEFGGTASASCSLGCGTVFSLTPPTSAGGAWTEAVLYRFTGGSDGAVPNGVVTGKGGALYGTTFANGGTVFKMKP
jgi:uncharacterized repeat protein (TIGR03803 family)